MAEIDKTGWCITPLDCDLVVGRLLVEDEIRIVKLCCEEGQPLRFPSIPSARDFLRTELAVSRSMLIPVPGGF